MTIEIRVSCDASGCHNSREIDDYTDNDVEHAGFHSHPYDGEQHYCRNCWPIVKKEFNPTGKDER